MMTKEAKTTELRKGRDAVPYLDTAKSAINPSRDDRTLTLTWKQTILELSQKEGYTGIAL